MGMDSSPTETSPDQPPPPTDEPPDPQPSDDPADAADQPGQASSQESNFDKYLGTDSPQPADGPPSDQPLETPYSSETADHYVDKNLNDVYVFPDDSINGNPPEAEPCQPTEHLDPGTITVEAEVKMVNESTGELETVAEVHEIIPPADHTGGDGEKPGSSGTDAEPTDTKVDGQATPAKSEPSEKQGAPEKPPEPNQSPEKTEPNQSPEKTETPEPPPSPQSQPEQGDSRGQSGSGRSEEGVYSFFEGGLLGDYSGNDSWSAVAGQTIGGFIPIWGQIADARDIAHAIGDVADGKDGAWTNLAINAVAVVPGLDALKGIGKVGKHADEAMNAAKHLNTVGTGAKHADGLVTGAKHADDAVTGATQAIDSTAVVNHPPGNADQELAAFQDYITAETGQPAHAAGQPIEMLPYGARQEAGKELGLPKSVEAAHGFPQAAGRGIPGYDGQHALTTLRERSVHRGMDQLWKDTFQQMRRDGRTTATAQEVYQTVAESIQHSSLPELEKASLQLRLQDEMFVELGLSRNQLLDLPYPNIKPASP